MAIISHKHQFIYLLNPRTASTATAQALLASTQCRYLPKENILAEDGTIQVPKKHTTLRQLDMGGLVPKHKLRKFFKFVTVRNPFDSIVSAWAKKVNDYAPLLDDPRSWVNKKPGYAEGLRRAAGLSFNEWIRQEYEETASQDGKGSINMPFVQGTDYQLRYEDLHSGLAGIRDKLGVGPDFTVSQINVTAGREYQDYRAYYDDRSVEIVAKVFRDELHLLDYAF